MFDSPVVDTSLSSFVVNIEILQVVVEVDASSTQISTEQGCVSSEDGGHVDVSLSAKRNSQTSLPFVEMGNDSCLGLTGRELPSARAHISSVMLTSPKNHATM